MWYYSDMTLKDRILEAETKFNQVQTERNELLAKAEELLVELNRLQGEHRVLQELVDSEDTKPNKKATVIEAVADKE